MKLNLLLIKLLIWSINNIDVMSIFEFIFISLISIGIIPNSKLIMYYRKIKALKNKQGTKRDLIGDESLNEKWFWIDEEDNHE